MLSSLTGFSRRLLVLPSRNYARGSRQIARPLKPSIDGKRDDGENKIPSSGLEAKRLLEEAVTDYLKVETADHQDPWSKPPYPPNALRSPDREQSLRSIRPSVDPMETSIFLFPGQGAQYVGMMKDMINYPNVPEMFRFAKDILGYDLLKLIMEGPETDLNRTIHCQPAIFLTALACVEKLKVKEPIAVSSCVTAAGFSLGEIAALVFADALSFEDGLKLIKVRAEAMQLASEKEPSGLMSVFVKADSKLDVALRAAVEHMKSKGHPFPVCRISNFLFTQAKVIGGHEMALKFIEENAKMWNLHCKRLPVSGAFHTPIMHDAYLTLKDLLKSVRIVQPLIPVHNNIDGRVYTSPDMIRRYLAKQVMSPVRWEQIMQIIYSRSEGQRFPRTYEMGPGQQLGIMLKKTNAKAANFYVSVDAAKYSE